MELKFCISNRELGAYLCFNRTFMELKLKFNHKADNF